MHNDGGDQKCKVTLSIVRHDWAVVARERRSAEMVNFIIYLGCLMNVGWICEPGAWSLVLKTCVKSTSIYVSNNERASGFWNSGQKTKGDKIGDFA